MNLLTRLSPDPASVRLDTWAIEPARPAITLTLRPRSRTARCPLRERRAGRVHGRYQRTLADLPWGDHAVAIRLRVRRLFCDNPRCERRNFAERLPGIAAPWARRTARLAGRLTAIGLALGGAAGARLSRELLVPAACNTADDCEQLQIGAVPRQLARRSPGRPGRFATGSPTYSPPTY